jgi:ADP-ribose pyrophosphatase YjhB (NUDIX family)
VLLIRRGKEPGLGIWSIPGGHQEFGETVREAAIREVLEETGLAIANLRLIDVVDVFPRRPEDPIKVHWTLVDFRGDWVAGDPRPGSDAAAARWARPDEFSAYGLWDETMRVIREGLALP